MLPRSRTVTRLLLLLAIALHPALVSTAAAAPQDRPALRGGSEEPRTAFDGPMLELDFPALHIGVAEYDAGPTGATVFYFPGRVMAVVDVRGGAPGTLNTDGLRLGYEDPFVHAIAFAGGSSYGLAVGPGVADEIKSRSDDPGHWTNIAVVAGAIIFDLGGRRYSTVTPDYELGRAALRAAKPGRFPQGARGAGRFAMQGWVFDDPQHSGQGGAFRQVGPTKIAVFTVVNSFGSIVDRDRRVVRCTHPGDDGCPTIHELIGVKTDTLQQADASTGEARRAGLTENTTLTLVVTNQTLDYSALQRLAVQVHTSMARAIQPFATGGDGDTLYAVTTREVENPGLSPRDLGVIASEVAWDAVLASVPRLEPRPDASPVGVDAETLTPYAGRYEFARGAQADIRLEAGRLRIDAPARASIYLPAGETVDLTPVSPTEFVLETKRADRLRFERSRDGRITGLVINPGRWPIRAARVSD
jgi:L-aminopeptidase/D-esterase-like protein